MSCRCILSSTTEHALLLRHRHVSLAMRPAAQLSRATKSSHSNISQHQRIHTTPRTNREWTMTPSREPSAHTHTSPTTPAPPPTPNDGHHLPPLSRELRTLMRLLPHSVVVCTSTTPANPKTHRPPTPRAMTMSSFTSLALSPTPVISFNISVPSRTYDAVEATRRFNIHILADDVNGARIADWLAKGNAGGRKVFEGLEEECECGFTEGSSVGDPPVLKGEGVLYVLRCRLLEEPVRGLVRVRDRVIVLGEVMEIVEGGADAEGERAGKRRRHERFGLLYADRRYRQLGNCITPAKDHG
ncbi:flavin reductase like domain-containing protein [Podospora aff. communis PSN243]|uniref:Flavin reductase like domain-containing protein n=1 Tax=Podospora aff. communis PSN243 TaxID=3040156 RepID=A0AAV9H142_9PEZI|nr:flavin reductase like domain-containing protein [Podospora aff. communis PSN243]